MPEAHVFITRRIPNDGLEVLRQAEVRYTISQLDDEAPVPRQLLRAGMGDCDVLICLLTEQVDREILEAGGQRLQGVSTMAVGYNNIDVAAATELGLPVANTPGVLTDTTADLTWALILATMRQIPQAHRYMVEGRYRIWGPNLFLGEDLSPGADSDGKALGIIGYGRIGRAVARRAAGFDVEVLAYDPHEKEAIEGEAEVSWAELDELLEQAHVVTIHTPLTPETHHLIGAAELRSMQQGAFLINTSRGEVVDEGALVEALREGWIAGAGLDVYEGEPAMHPGLGELDNVVLLPHIGSASRRTRGRMAEMAATSALCFLRGEPAGFVVNPEVYDTEAHARRRSSRA